MMSSEHEEIFRQWKLLTAAFRVFSKMVNRELTVKELDEYDHVKWTLERALADLGYFIDENDKLVPRNEADR